MVGITDADKPRKRKSHTNSVAFADEEEIINPEDVDPSIGKFRNMIQTTIIPTKVSSEIVWSPTLGIVIILCVSLLMYHTVSECSCLSKCVILQTLCRVHIAIGNPNSYSLFSCYFYDH